MTGGSYVKAVAQSADMIWTLVILSLQLVQERCDIDSDNS